MRTFFKKFLTMKQISFFRIKFKRVSTIPKFKMSVLLIIIIYWVSTLKKHYCWLQIKIGCPAAKLPNSSQQIQTCQLHSYCTECLGQYNIKDLPKCETSPEILDIIKSRKNLMNAIFNGYKEVKNTNNFFFCYLLIILWPTYFFDSFFYFSDLDKLF